MIEYINKDNIINDDNMKEYIDKIFVNINKAIKEVSMSKKIDHYIPGIRPTILKEDQNVPEIRSTLLKNDNIDEKIDLLTKIYNGITSNDTKKLTIDDLKSIFACFSQDNTDEEYDIMMKILDSKNAGRKQNFYTHQFVVNANDETGLDKFLSLFKLNSIQIQKEEILSTRSAENIDCFKRLSNGKNFLDINDVNRIYKVAKRLGVECHDPDDVKKFIKQKRRIYYDEFNYVFKNSPNPTINERK
ncbi:uncharacterized protein LOC126897507 isoform X2 [Daktulosphaira vitifoliae]|uniref:uncharacterized protein LOC126897507 isoform X2 n=1 Tax=Daktulosphaira vitifoliae TaxID=58002 RepID=UPI0021AA1624|nr:uncharacterized protein LOC126897507 isoform X2 [Daktulosphaira vitifoliae]